MVCLTGLLGDGGEILLFHTPSSPLTCQPNPPLRETRQPWLVPGLRSLFVRQKRKNLFDALQTITIDREMITGAAGPVCLSKRRVCVDFDPKPRKFARLCVHHGLSPSPAVISSDGLIGHGGVVYSGGGLGRGEWLRDKGLNLNQRSP